jgi:hypothetical protein
MRYTAQVSAPRVAIADDGQLGGLADEAALVHHLAVRNQARVGRAKSRSRDAKPTLQCKQM